MGELDIQKLWEKQASSLSRLTTLCGQSLQIYHPGHQNLVSGPDFEMSHILLQGAHWFGSVEIHIREDDWYAHRHHFDTAYETCILHVVLFASPKNRRAVRADGTEVPTVVLPSSWAEKQVSSPVAIAGFSDSAACGLLEKRLTRKITDLFRLIPHQAEGHYAKLNWLVANAFFTSTNAVTAYQFISYWHGLTSIQRFPLEPLLLDGSLIEKTLDHQGLSWKVNYPWAHPSQKLAWVCFNLSAIQSAFHQANLSSDYKWFTHAMTSLDRLPALENGSKGYMLGQTSILTAYLNGIIPYLYFQGINTGLDATQLLDQIAGLLSHCPAERNHKTQLATSPLPHALASQTFLEYLRAQSPSFQETEDFKRLVA